jgi:hypothetical protein
MHDIAVGQQRATLVGEVADGAVAINAGLLGLIRAEGAAAVDQPVQIVVLKRPACGKQTVNDRSDVAVVVVKGGNKSIRMPGTNPQSHFFSSLTAC